MVPYVSELVNLYEFSLFWNVQENLRQFENLEMLAELLSSYIHFIFFNNLDIRRTHDTRI